MMSMPMVSPHMRTQSPHRMHLLGSRTTAGLLSSRVDSSRLSPKRTRRTPKRMASSCRRQSPLFSQVVQEQLWEASSSSRIIRRCFNSRAVLVRMDRPSRGFMEQEVSILPRSSSTTHMRQAP